MAATDLIFDPWTPMSFKRTLGNKRVASQTWLAPTWVGDHSRRLTAYKILQAYVDNAAREFLQETDEDKKDAHREYGDAALVVNTILAAVLGEDQQIVVEGADGWDPVAGEALEGADAAQAEAAWKLQEWLQGWAQDERLGLKMLETERNAISLGDGLYTVGVSNQKERVRARVFDPGFYFPVLDDGNEDEYPSKVHLAWELETDDKQKKVIRRITWECVEIEGLNRSLPWNDDPTNKTVLMSDGTWELDLGAPQTVEDLTQSKVTWATYTDANGDELEWKDVDLGVDFIPVIHLPNTVSLLNHYGRSSLSTVLQILDDISNADTDLNNASSTTGTPPVVLRGASMGATKPSYGAGKVWEVSADGGLEVLDTSRALDALLKYIEALLQRMSVNVRVPESVLGRVKIDGQLAGVTLALSFGPLGAMVKEMRLVREEKYPLLLKFIWRMAISAGWDDVPEEWFPTKIEFGAYLPQDQNAAVEIVSKLLATDPPGISVETSIRILVNAGLPIDDALEEVRRITGRDFKGALELLEATGDEDAVFEYLGRERPPDEPPVTAIQVAPPAGVPVAPAPVAVPPVEVP